MLKMIFACLSLLILYSVCEAADPVFVDLRAVVNRGIEDDGAAGNAKGGWSDEGVNDMFTETIGAAAMLYSTLYALEQK